MLSLAVRVQEEGLQTQWVSNIAQLDRNTSKCAGKRDGLLCTLCILTGTCTFVPLCAPTVTKHSLLKTPERHGEWVVGIFIFYRTGNLIRFDTIRYDSMRCDHRTHGACGWRWAKAGKRKNGRLFAWFWVVRACNSTSVRLMHRYDWLHVRH